MVIDLIVVVFPVVFVLWLFGGGADTWWEAEEEAMREIEKYLN